MAFKFEPPPDTNTASLAFGFCCCTSGGVADAVHCRCCWFGPAHCCVGSHAAMAGGGNNARLADAAVRRQEADLGSEVHDDTSESRILGLQGCSILVWPRSGLRKQRKVPPHELRNLMV